MSYFCEECWRRHRSDSKIGKKHIEFKLEDCPKCGKLIFNKVYCINCGYNLRWKK